MHLLAQKTVIYVTHQLEFLDASDLFQGLQMGSNYWIAWATYQEGKVSREKMIGIFVLMLGGSSLFILGRAVLLTTIAIETAQRLFHGMITSVFHAPISLFDSTPSSRILNRVSFLNISHSISIVFLICLLLSKN